jgi:PKD-like domain/Secretion system C-terminal sorting domain
VSGNGNNGTGVGGYKQGYCGTASDRIRVVTQEDCGGTPPTCPTPTVAVVGPDSVCAFQEEPVTFTANVTGTTAMTTYLWAVPADWEILSGQGTAAIQVVIGSVSGQVSVSVANSCGTKAVNNREVFVNENCDGIIVPLPVELLSFEGEATKSGVLLEWTTATEKNNDRFEVERSADGVAFAKIAEVKGSGTTSVKRTYSLRDAKASRGTHYYRLKQVDIDGTSEYSKMIVVENKATATAAASILVAPNPANGQFTIALDHAEGAQLQILDMNGRLLHTQSLSQGARELNFNTSSLGMRSGLYLISIKSAAGSSQAKLVVR